MQQEEVEIHLIKTIIFLKKVTITVRFPCSISFALKNCKFSATQSTISSNIVEFTSSKKESVLSINQFKWR